jgi:hypothetical protein
MSTLAITAARFVAISARYAAGRWSNIPTNTLLVFNATDFGLNILINNVLQKKTLLKTIPKNLAIPATLVIRTLTCLTAVYVTSRFTEPMPLNTAAFTNLASLAASVSVYIIAKWATGQK